MEITSVIIKRNDKEGALKALATIIIDDAIAIHNIKLIEGEKGMFMAMPSRKSDKGFIDFVHPINTETRKMMQDAILAEYHKEEDHNNE